ncbi:MAG TPA: hypothetical protein VFD07_08405 [Candidatus Krumholzibacteria bacterium]|nr:hypothetical protein [Candidatus Krumholzibacteria bacterium]
MAANLDRTVTANEWVVPILAATAILQMFLMGACLGAAVLFVGAAHSGFLADVLSIATALVEAMLRIALHVLTLR